MSALGTQRGGEPVEEGARGRVVGLAHVADELRRREEE